MLVIFSLQQRCCRLTFTITFYNTIPSVVSGDRQLVSTHLRGGFFWHVLLAFVLEMWFWGRKYQPGYFWDINVIMVRFMFWKYTPIFDLKQRRLFIIVYPMTCMKILPFMYIEYKNCPWSSPINKRKLQWPTFYPMKTYLLP